MNFFTSYISPKAKEYVAEVLDSGMLSEGEWVRRFEKAIEEFYDNKTKVVTTNSGTSSLHLALATLGVGQGDEVIIPPLTFVATGLAVLYCGAKPVFADILNDGTIDPESIAMKITPKTKAIIVVNWAGKACNCDEIEGLANLHGIKLIIDAAQSFGSRIYGDAVCFSFQATKHLTTGDGGAVAFRYPVDYERGRRLSWFGIDKEKDLPGFLGEREYDREEVGCKYHMNNIAAAIGLG
jgi:perosamine synthetase